MSIRSVQTKNRIQKASCLTAKLTTAVADLNPAHGDRGYPVPGTAGVPPAILSDAGGKPAVPRNPLFPGSPLIRVDFLIGSRLAHSLIRVHLRFNCIVPAFWNEKNLAARCSRNPVWRVGEAHRTRGCRQSRVARSPPGSAGSGMPRR